MLTENRIREAKPQAKPYFMWDQRVTGLGVKVTPKGVSSYVLQYRAGGKSRRVTLGRTAELSLKDARNRASSELVAIRAGREDLATRRAKQREAPTVAVLWERFETVYAPARIDKGLITARTVNSYRLVVQRYVLPAVGAAPVTDVTRGDVEAILAGVPGRSQHNKVKRVISRLFTLAEHWEWRPQHTNPARGIEAAREEPRDRVLSPEELADMAAALAHFDARMPGGVAAIRVAAITGLRIGEVLKVRWEDVAFESGRLTLPTTKTGRRGHDLPTAALELLQAIPRRCEWVFTNRAGGRLKYAIVYRLFGHVCERAGLENVRLHDLRRTVMTQAAMAGVGTHVLRDLLGHRTTAMADRYIRSVGNPVRDAREQVGTTMAAMMAGQTGDVVLMDRKARG